MPGFSGPEGVEVFRLLELRVGVELERDGFKHRRSLTAAARREFGLPRSADHNEVIAAIEARLQTVAEIARRTPGALSR